MGMTASVVAPARPVARQVLAAVLLAVLVAGGLGVLALWWQSPSTRAIRTGADVFVDLGRATGMLAAYLLLVEVTLMARTPVLERRIGADVIVTVHRWVGSYLFGLVVVHVATTVVGYAEGERERVARDGTLVWTYPYVLLGDRTPPPGGRRRRLAAADARATAL